MKTVGDFIRKLKEFPEDWPVVVATPAGGGIAIEHREIKGHPAIAIFGSNGGRFGENPITEQEYEKVSADFMSKRGNPDYRYTSAHGDHRMYLWGYANATCYGTHYDRRIIERMVAEGLAHVSRVDIDRVRRIEGVM